MLERNRVMSGERTVYKCVHGHIPTTGIHLQRRNTRTCVHSFLRLSVRVKNWLVGRVIDSSETRESSEWIAVDGRGLGRFWRLHHGLGDGRGHHHLSATR